MSSIINFTYCSKWNHANKKDLYRTWPKDLGFRILVKRKHEYGILGSVVMKHKTTKKVWISLEYKRLCNSWRKITRWSRDTTWWSRDTELINHDRKIGEDIEDYWRKKVKRNRDTKHVQKQLRNDVNWLGDEDSWQVTETKFVHTDGMCVGQTQG
jgi:hypothetical protein